MHIADGVLPTAVAVGCYACALAGVGLSLRRLEHRELPKIAVVTSSFFVASLIHLPLGPTSVHLLLPGLVGALLGPVALLSISVGLFLQSLLFQCGGLTALGANSLMMGLPALLCGLAFRRWRGTSKTSNAVVGGLLSGLGVLLATLLLALLLASGGDSFFGVAKLAVVVHLPVMVVEGLVGGFVIAFLFRVKPELLGPRQAGRRP